MSSVPRQTLGHYEILAPLGAGGMGEVFVARDPILGRKVAVKMLPTRLAGDRDTLTRFTQEARSASALNHPNIITIHEVGTDNGTPFIVMEYVEGRDLRTMIGDAPLPNRKTVDIAAQIADGLAAAHERGIVHRDLKPENVMYTKDGFAKILDFGLAKLIAPTSDDDKTMMLEVPGTNPGTILGTVGYMSPEQATGKRLDFRSDQFAFGAILYELATGKSAFEGDNAIDTLSAILHDDPRPIREFNAKVPVRFCEIVTRLLEKEPNDRYSSTRDLARELRTLRDRVAAEQSGMDLPRPPIFTRRRRGLAIAGAATLIAAVTGLGIWLNNRVGDADPSATSAVPLNLQQKNYLAVMRFTEAGGDATSQLVADGLADTLSARLARIPSIQVMRASDAETLASTDVDQVGRNLGANLVLRGSMQRDGGRLRITYSVVDIRTRQQIGGNVVDGDTEDLFAVQDKLVESVVTALDPKAVVGKISRLDPGVSQKRYLEALGYLRRYDKEESLNAAIAILEDLGTGTNSASIQAALGRAYLAKFILTRDPELTPRATLHCERALASDPQNTDVRVTLGQVRLQTGRPDDAIREFNQALAQQPSNVDALLGLGEAYKTLAKPTDAESAYKRAIEQQPQYWGSYSHLGVFYLLNGRYPESAKMFEKVVALVPDNSRGYANLGASYQLMGRYDEAIGLLSRSIEKSPTAQAYSNLGTCYYFLGRYKDSAGAFEKAVEMLPNKHLYWANLGDAYRWVPGGEAHAARAFDRAIQLCQEELERNPHDSRIRARFADCLAKRGRTQQAQQQIASALQVNEKSPGVLYRAAVIAAIGGDQRAALSWLQRAIENGYSRAEIALDPEFISVRKDPAYQELIRRAGI
jgi:serine/threonine protein kinase/tetratricopeptide (TPR) repeat protein